MARECKGQAKSGNPCKAIPLKKGTIIDGVTVTGRWCRQHDPNLPDSARIGGAQPGAGRPRNPSAIDVLRERIEGDIEATIAPLLEGLNAEKSVVVGNGPSAHVESVPDIPTRIAAARELLDRGYGRPKQVSEISGPEGGPLELVSPADARAKSAKAAGLLASIGAIDAPD